MRRKLTALLLFAFVLFVLSEAKAEKYGEYLNQEVSEITLKLPPGFVERKIRRMLKVKVGKRFTRRRIRRSINKIYLNGGVANVRIMAERDGDKVRVLVEVDPMISIRDIFFLGNTRFNEDEIRRFMRVWRGDEFRTERVDGYEEAIAAAYQKIGYMDTDVRIKSRIDREENKADLFVNIREGQVYKIISVEFSGDPKIDPEILRKKLGRRVKQEKSYREDSLKKGMEKLKKYYKKQHHYEVEISDPLVIHDDETKRTEIDIEVVAGSRVFLHYDPEAFTCWERRRSINRYLEVDKQRRFNKWVAVDMSRRITLFRQRKGYVDADVASRYEFDEDEDQKDIFFEMEPGRKWKIESVEFPGAERFGQKELAEVLDPGKFYVPEDFTDALTRVVKRYNEEGYLRASLGEVEVERDEEKDRLILRVPVEEGVQTLIDRIVFEGNRIVDESELRERIPLSEGMPLNPFAIDQCRIRLLAPYLRDGYTRARVRSDIRMNPERDRADLIFILDENGRFFVGNIYIRGNRLTKTHVIQREMFVREDDPYNYEDVVLSEQALSRLGFFKSVKIDPLTGGYEDEYIDLIVRVTERNAGYQEVGAGYNTSDGYQAAVEIGHRNLAGHGRNVSLRTQASVSEADFVFDEHLISLGFVWPWIARIPLDGRLNVSDEHREEISFEEERLSLDLGVDVKFERLFRLLHATEEMEGLHKASRYITGSLDYNLEQDFVFNVDPEVDTERGEFLIASLNPLIIRDSRNDPFNPSSGSVNSVKLELAAPYLGSEFHFLKLTGRTSWYFSLLSLLPSMGKTVFAVNLSSGWGMSLKEGEEIPVNRRFFLGGRTTIRGFVQGEVSPLAEDGKTPVGGDFMFHGNMELRIPLVWGLGLLLFWDTGNVYPSIDDLEPSNIRTTTGLGLRYLTPVGPISADYGFKLNKREGETLGEFYLTIGNAF